MLAAPPVLAALPPAVLACGTGIHLNGPQHGQVWLVGRSKPEQLVWVRRRFVDGVVDVVPLVLQVEYADELWVLVSPGACTLPVELGAPTMLRTHIVVAACRSFVGTLDIAEPIEEVMMAALVDRPPRNARTGPAGQIFTEQHFGFRQSVRAFFEPLQPGLWDPMGRRSPSA